VDSRELKTCLGEARITRAPGGSPCIDTHRARPALVATLALTCTGVTAGPGAATGRPRPHCDSVLTRGTVLIPDLTG
jgi:hypothetical protein